MSRDNITSGASSREQPCLVGVQNVGSTARDVCAIERNFLSHARLALLLSLLSTAVLSDSASFFNGGSADAPKWIILVGSLCFVAAVAVIAMGWYAYEESRKEMMRGKAFIGEFKAYEVVLLGVAIVVTGSCLYLLIIGE